MSVLTSWQKGALWYWPIGLVILGGYAAGVTLWVGATWLDWFAEINNSLRPYAGYFGCGVCGATLFCNTFFGKDANEYLSGKSDTPPNFLDPLGYFLRIIEGGFTGVLLIFAVEAGEIVVNSASSASAIPMQTAVLLSFCGGLAVGKVRSELASWVDRLFKKDVEEPGAQPAEAQPAGAPATVAPAAPATVVGGTPVNDHPIGDKLVHDK